MNAADSVSPTNAAEGLVQSALAAVQNSSIAAMAIKRSDGEALFTWVEAELALNRELERSPRSIRFQTLGRHIALLENTWRIRVSGFQEEEYEILGVIQSTRGHVTYVLDIYLRGSKTFVKQFGVEYLDTQTRDPGTDGEEKSTEGGAQILWSWDGAAAAKYSDDWALTINPAYREYPNDCTNFASQCLLRGGKDQVGSVINRPDDDVWFYGSLESTTSYTWAGAQNLYRHLVLHTNTTLENLAALRPGDLILLKPPGANPQWHTMVVGARTTNDALMNYHSQNTYRRSFLQIKQALQPNTTIYYFKIGNSYQSFRPS